MVMKLNIFKRANTTLFPVSLQLKGAGRKSDSGNDIGANNDAKIYVRRSMTMQDLVFFLLTYYHKQYHWMRLSMIATSKTYRSRLRLVLSTEAKGQGR